jgi:hypothetical protein
MTKFLCGAWFNCFLKARAGFSFSLNFWVGTEHFFGGAQRKRKCVEWRVMNSIFLIRQNYLIKNLREIFYELLKDF